MKYTWSYIYGALEINTAKALFMYIPTVSLASSKLFLEQITATDPQAIHVVIWDNAGFHQQPTEPDRPSQVRLLPLPAYGPELNPIEKLWDIVKRHTANKILSTLESIESNITEVLAPLWQKAERVVAFLGDNWLTRGVATFMNHRKAVENLV